MMNTRVGRARPLRLVAAAAIATAMVATAAPAAAAQFPEVIPLPNGWQPEGIAEGRGTIVYSGSRASGDIVALNVRTGERYLVVDAPTGRTAIGIEQDRFGRFFVAGGATGDVFVYNADGTVLRTYDFASEGTFVNDVVVTKDAAWFTDSARGVLYQVPIAPNGALGEAVIVPLSGDYQHVSGFNLNGIEATRNGKTLVAVHSGAGVLYRIDPTTGHASRIDLGGPTATVVNGDGLLLQGRKLYVVQNRFNKITVIRLNRTFTSGQIVDTISSEQFDVPTTIARFGNKLYLVNARFSTAATPQTPYWITAVRR
jgi:streptogramin lyase